MSAVYLHNSIYHSRDISTEDRSNFPHSRNLSTVSSATLLTNTTHHSQPTEPLLPHSTSPQASDYDIVSRNTIPRFPSKREHAFQDNGPISRDERGLLSSLRRRPLRGMRWLKTGLDLLIGVWALYNAVRYFFAFTVYESISGETAALALGVCAGLSFAFLTCAIAFSIFRPQLLRHGVSYNTLSTVYWCLTYLAILLLFAPAATNFALVFLWRNKSDLQLQPRHRCYVDIDLVWSRSSQRMCKTNTAAWGVWVALASVRLAVTSAVLLGYQIVLYKLSAAPDILATTFRRKHRVNPSDLFASPYDAMVAGPQPATGVPPSRASSRRSNPLVSQSQGTIQTRFGQHTQQSQSSSSLSSRTKFSSSQQTHTHYTQPKLSRSRSSGLSTTTGLGAATGSDAASHGALGVVYLPSVPEGDGGDIAGYASPNRFSNAVSMIDREMEAALDFARSDGAPSLKSRKTNEGGPSARGEGGDESDEETEENPSYTQRRFNNNGSSSNGHTDDNDSHDRHDRVVDSDDDEREGEVRYRDDDDEDEDDFYRGRRGSDPLSVPLSSLGYNEFGQPYPPDLDIPMMNGYIRRMPTIESMGSRELGSSVAGSSYGSRPGTRSAMRESWAGSEMLGVQVVESEQEGGAGGGSARGNYGDVSPDTSADHTTADVRMSGSQAGERNSSTSFSVQAERLSALSALDGNGSARSSDFRARAREATELGEMLDKMMDDLIGIGVEGAGPLSMRDSNGGESTSSREREMGMLGAQGRYSSSTKGSSGTDVSYVTAKTGSAKSRDSATGAVPPPPPKPVAPSLGRP
ncbi:hypothetical protein FA13DRAFT_118995 [Coprinellus micaceus]|uniref:Uncharacterized protein n=1 Tax=Coprinellus micaceus TaxID=71717 RepID=A0A4Y7TIU6_COPMI|nr:hypothetical protein FA13DRAFT_118995 [Coprinellus micaceus]